MRLLLSKKKDEHAATVKKKKSVSATVSILDPSDIRNGATMTITTAQPENTRVSGLKRCPTGAQTAAIRNAVAAAADNLRGKYQPDSGK